VQALSGISSILRAAAAPLGGLALAGGVMGASALPVGAAAPAVIPTAPEYQFIAELNADRGANGLPPLAVNGVLSGIARQRAQQIATGAFTHYDASGNLIFAGLLNAAGFPYLFAGENLAENNYPWSQSLNMANQALMNSPEHRANILNARYNEVGVSIIAGANGQFFYTQEFAQAS
jgi:uncharacterized protein YkwD